MSDALPNPNDDLELPVVPRSASQTPAMVEQVVRVAKALSDPIRVRMLNLMAEGRGCCGLPPVQVLNVPGDDESEGICVCEFQEWYGLAQSKVSYHLKILKEAGLVTEDVRGKWTFYSVNKETARQMLELMRLQLKL